MFKGLNPFLFAILISLAGWPTQADVKTNTFAYKEANTRPVFTDTTLTEILHRSENSDHLIAIYSWSPRMVLSAVGLSQFQQIAKDLEIETHFVVDQDASEHDIQDTAVSFEAFIAARLASRHLQQLGFDIHYPCLLLIRHGQIISPIRPGYDEPERLKMFLQNHFVSGVKK